MTLWVVMLAGLAFGETPTPPPSQQGAANQCQTKCNVTASECMKPCSADAKDGKKMLECLKSCEVKNTQCKAECPK
jgi:hypothetical protein